jgi:hypothetical protein
LSASVLLSLLPVPTVTARKKKMMMMTMMMITRRTATITSITYTSHANQNQYNCQHHQQQRHCCDSLSYLYIESDIKKEERKNSSIVEMIPHFSSTLLLMRKCGCSHLIFALATCNNDVNYRKCVRQKAVIAEGHPQQALPEIMVTF